MASTTDIGLHAHRRDALWPYLLAVLVTLAVVAARAALWPLLGDAAPLLLLVAAPVIASHLGGLGPGLLATALSAGIGVLLFVAPVGEIGPLDTAEWVRIAVFVALGVLVSWTIDSRAAALARLEHQHATLRDAQARLAHRERQARQTLEAAPSGMLLVGRDGGVLFANLQAERMFDHPRGGLDGRPIERLVPGLLRGAPMHDRAGDRPERAARTFGERRELAAVRPDGSSFAVEIGLSPVDLDGRPLMLASVLDISARKRAEDEVRRLNVELEARVLERTAQLAAANDDLRTFTDTVAHDLRAPLRTMQGFAGALLEDHADALDAEGRHYAARIVAAAARMDRLVLDLLDYARLTRAAMVLEPVRLGPVLDEALEPLAEPIRARGARVDVAGPMPAVIAHRATLGQVVTNLVSNALTFVEPHTTPAVRIDAEHRGACIRLSVRDNGIGIDPAHHERVFRAFERLHGVDRFPGTGIGLAIVRRGIERMNGRVGVESAPGEGSVFWFELSEAPSAPSA